MTFPQRNNIPRIYPRITFASSEYFNVRIHVGVEPENSQQQPLIKLQSLAEYGSVESAPFEGEEGHTICTDVHTDVACCNPIVRILADVQCTVKTHDANGVWVGDTLGEIPGNSEIYTAYTLTCPSLSALCTSKIESVPP